MASKRKTPKRTMYQSIIASFSLAFLVMTICVVIFFIGFRGIITNSISIFKRFVEIGSMRNDLNDIGKFLINQSDQAGIEVSEQNFEKHMERLDLQLEEFKQSSLGSDIYYRFIDFQNMTSYLRVEVSHLFSAMSAGKPQGYLNISIDEITRIKDAIVTELSDILLDDLSNGEKQFLQNTLDYQLIQILFIVGLVMMIAVCFSLVLRIVHRVVRPIKDLQTEIGRVRDGVPKPVRIDANGIVEVETLIDFFNRMAIQAQRYVDQVEGNARIEIRLKQEELKNLECMHLLTQSEYRFLQAQINPHFLFNTINSGMAMSAMENAPRTKELLDNFAQYLRYNIGRHGDMVRLEEEFEICKAYINIQNIRHDHKIDYVCDIAEAARRVYIPYMIVLPLVENAILHGLEPKDADAMLIMNADAEGDMLLISVADNGIGIPDEKLEEIMRETETKGTGNSIGISNVARRLQLLYGSNCLSIHSKYAIGTIMTLSIPIGNQNAESRE